MQRSIHKTNREYKTPPPPSSEADVDLQQGQRLAVLVVIIRILVTQDIKQRLGVAELKVWTTLYFAHRALDSGFEIISRKTMVQRSRNCIDEVSTFTLIVT